MVVTWPYDGDDSAAGLFLGSSAPVTQHAREVRIVLARRVRILEDMEEEKATVWELGIDLPVASRCIRPPSPMMGRACCTTWRDGLGRSCWRSCDWTKTSSRPP